MLQAIFQTLLYVTNEERPNWVLLPDILNVSIRLDPYNINTMIVECVHVSGEACQLHINIENLLGQGKHNTTIPASYRILANSVTLRQANFINQNLVVHTVSSDKLHVSHGSAWVVQNQNWD